MEEDITFAKRLNILSMIIAVIFLIVLIAVIIDFGKTIRDINMTEPTVTTIYKN